MLGVAGIFIFTSLLLFFLFSFVFVVNVSGSLAYISVKNKRILLSFPTEDRRMTMGFIMVKIFKF